MIFWVHIQNFIIGKPRYQFVLPEIVWTIRIQLLKDSDPTFEFHSFGKPGVLKCSSEQGIFKRLTKMRGNCSLAGSLDYSSCWCTFLSYFCVFTKIHKSGLWGFKMNNSHLESSILASKLFRQICFVNFVKSLSYSCNKITAIWIRISHQNWNNFFSSASCQNMI